MKNHLLASPALALLLALGAPGGPARAQDGDAPPAPPNGGDAGSSRALRAEDLRQRIHEMRMNLLLGGDQVRRAEAEAVDFYGRKSELVEERLDSVQAELTEKRASYDVTLDRALGAAEAAARQAALRDAAALRGQLTTLQGESSELVERRARLAEIIRTVEARERERQRLAAEIETSSVGIDSPLLGVPYGGLGLAPAAIEEASATPLAEDALVEDLLARDPRAARRILFESDPVGYWRRFPLQPPAAVLQQRVPLPPADPPARR